MPALSRSIRFRRFKSSASLVGSTLFHRASRSPRCAKGTPMSRGQSSTGLFFAIPVLMAGYLVFRSGTEPKKAKIDVVPKESARPIEVSTAEAQLRQVEMSHRDAELRTCQDFVGAYCSGEKPRQLPTTIEECKAYVRKYCPDNPPAPPASGSSSALANPAPSASTSTSARMP